MRVSECDRLKPVFLGTITSLGEHVQDQMRAVGKVFCKVTSQRTFPWNLPTGTLELRLDAEAPDRPKCSAVPVGSL